MVAVIRKPRIGQDLIDWLRSTHPHKCITQGQSEIDAHRYAAKVELAEKIIRMGEADAEHDINYIEED